MAGKRVLLVEGRDDEHVVKSICGRLELGVIDRIEPQDGKDPLLDTLPVKLKESDLTVLGIILDADDDLKSRWRALSGRLRPAGYENISDTPDPEGSVFMPPENCLLPRLGIWLMPNNQVPGILEDFLRFLVPDCDALLPHVEQAVNTLPETRFDSLKRPKVLMHTWLAWQEEPGKPYGQAITARYLDTSLPAGEAFAAWLKRVFFMERS